MASTAGKLTSNKPPKPVATYMKRVFCTDGETDPLLSFFWPTPHWIVAITLQKASSHYFAKFINEHLLLKKTFYYEIGLDDKWLHVSHCDHEGKFILCASSGKVLKVSLPLEQNREEPGKVVGTVFTPKAILGITWDKHHLGCYALLDDKKTLLHVDFGGSGFKEVTVFEKEIRSSQNIQLFHVNEEGSMALGDNVSNEIHFFKTIGPKPTVTVKEPPKVLFATPTCVNTRRGEKLWYVMWKGGSFPRYVIELYVYDSSFQLIGPVPNLCVEARSPNRVTFCFQGDYIAVTIDDRVEVYVLS